jgi:hypothetical protein
MRESITTLDTLIQQSRSAPPLHGFVPPDYIIYECHCDDAGTKDADLVGFRALLSQSLAIDPDAIVSFQICAGSLIVKALFQYRVTFNKVTKFNGPGNQKWKVHVVHEIKATPEINELIEEIKQNSHWLSIPERDIRWDFLLSDPNVPPLHFINTTLVDFTTVDQFVTNSIEKSFLDLEISDISFYGNSSFYQEFKKNLKPDSKLKYLFYGASQPNGFIGDAFDPKPIGSMGGWYGRGCYTTSCLDYALCHQYQQYHFTRQDVLGYIAARIRDLGGTFRMLLLLCNLGNCQTIDQRIDGQQLPDGIDSYFVRVQQGRPVPAVPNPDIPIYDEFVFKNEYALTPQFIVTFRPRKRERLLIWRNTSFPRYGNHAIFDEMKRSFKGLTMVTYDCDEDALHRINKTEDKTRVFIVTNRANEGEKFLAKCRVAGVTTPMLVFCVHANGWIPMPGVTISTVGNAVPKFIWDVVLKS